MLEHYTNYKRNQKLVADNTITFHLTVINIAECYLEFDYSGEPEFDAYEIYDTHNRKFIEYIHGSEYCPQINRMSSTVGRLYPLHGSFLSAFNKNKTNYVFEHAMQCRLSIHIANSSKGYICNPRLCSAELQPDNRATEISYVSLSTQSIINKSRIMLQCIFRDQVAFCATTDGVLHVDGQKILIKGGLPNYNIPRNCLDPIVIFEPEDEITEMKDICCAMAYRGRYNFTNSEMAH